MKKMNYVPDVVITNIHGAPAAKQSPDGRPGILEPMSQLVFVLERLVDAKYAGPRQGIEAIEFVLAARDEVRSQAKAAEARGYWLLEDERAKALKEAMLHPSAPYNPNFQHCFLQFLLAGRDMMDAMREEIWAPAAAPSEQEEEAPRGEAERLARRNGSQMPVGQS